MVRMPSGIKIKKPNLENLILLRSAALSLHCSSLLLIHSILISCMEHGWIWLTGMLFLFGASIPLFECCCVNKEGWRVKPSKANLVQICNAPFEVSGMLCGKLGDTNYDLHMRVFCWVCKCLFWDLQITEISSCVERVACYLATSLCSISICHKHCCSFL